MAKNVLLIGATGFVGSAILNELISRGHKVTAIVRDANSVEDYAVAMVDELEQENHHKERFTAAY